MKRKLISLGIALAMVLSIGLIWAVPALAVDYTIQGAIDAASPGDTVVVPSGTYNEDILISANLTLEGAQASVCAPGRTGEESEIVGSIKVTSDASYVAIDGFTITGTAGGAMDGVCIRTESANVTVVNNIVIAVAVAGGYTYSGIIDLDGLTDALVECNSISGVYDQARSPNVIRLGITGAGTVTVANNEMTEVGGGGGVGVMSDNASAIINIVGNDIDHCGDGMWSYNSIFDTLLIDGNTFSHNNACHGGACENTDTGVKLVGTIEGVVTIEGNDFLDNTIQVDNSAGVVDLNDVLANNTFDKAVVVDNPGSSLLPFIWSFIQDAVDAAVTGDTVTVMPGTYDEDVTINTGLTLCSAVEHEAVVTGTIVINADDVTVDGFSIQDFSQIPTPDWAAIYIPSGTGVVVSNNLIDGSAISPVTYLTVGIHTLYGGSAEATLEGNTITNVRLGIYNQGAEMLITGNTIDGAAHCGIGVDTSLGTEITENDIINNDIGIEVFQANVVVYFNNIVGNASYGLWSNGPEVDAINNYWGSASGPTYNPGCGDRVSDDVLYEPWLLGPVVPEEEPVTYDKTLVLQDGWTLVSTNNWINASSGNSTWVGKILAYTHTVSGGYVSAELADLVPVDGMYVKTDGCGGIGIIYSDSYAAASIKDLEAGWNLISSAIATDNDENGGNTRAVLSPLRWVQVGDEEGVCMTTLVSQGAYNLHSESFYLPTLNGNDWEELEYEEDYNLNPFDGYWVFLNADKSGFGVIPQ